MRGTRFALVSGLILAASLGALPLVAQNDCDALLVDNAHVVGPTGTKNISAAADKLTAQGADVRVRTEKSLGPYSSPDYLEKALEEQCQSWRSPNGRRKNNLIVIMFVKPDWSAIYPGSGIASIVTDADQANIVTNMINPKIRDANLPGALVAGLKGVSSAMDGKHIAASPAGPPRAATETKIIHQAAADYSGFFSFLKWLLGFAVAGAIIFFLVRFLRNRNEQVETRQSAQQNAQLAQGEVVELLSKLNDDFPAFEIFAKPINADRVARARHLLDVASETFTGLGKATLCDPNQAGLSPSQYGNMISRFYGLKDDLLKVRALMDGINPEGDRRGDPRPDFTPETKERSPKTPAPPSQASHSRGTASGSSSRRRMSPLADPPLVGSRGGSSVVNNTTIIRDEPTYVPIVIEREPDLLYRERGYPVINPDPMDRASERTDPVGFSARAGSADDDAPGFSARAGGVEPSSRSTTY